MPRSHRENVRRTPEPWWFHAKRGHAGIDVPCRVRRRNRTCALPRATRISQATPVILRPNRPKSEVEESECACQSAPAAGNPRAQICGGRVGVTIADTVVVAARGDFPITDQKRAIGKGFQSATFKKRITRGVKQRRPQDFAPFACRHRWTTPLEAPAGIPGVVRARRIAKKIFSGVAGMGNSMGPPPLTRRRRCRRGWPRARKSPA